MIGGIVMILVALWIYQSAMRAKTSNVMMWVAIGAVTFFVVQLGFIDLNLYILEAIRSGEGGSDYERDLISVGDRKNEGGFQGFGGVLLSVYLELMPSVVGVLAAALIRVKFITKEPITVGNLFGDVKEMFQSIKQSFKTSGQ
ncbi:hypothetical protein V3O24_08835 [Methylobacter sp. Wu8]|jgi:hypothetical protein|uniref:Uncharacterized protein n=1 Tax=Methylobacter tundripaludum TaxID=173365 RepID=A0A2S6H4A5_9GAMM|nr:hypothetical protein [Methylobacter tundripaludum]MCF7964136.1 hypothetical protein [Methylobacter tundripaludum]MCK9637260.1 hypothetical protein [Methylobacter tundripaludum]PPK72322.1 hypothetical protein B0F88_104115 [Methylobacter tundripaludum]